MIVNNDPKVRQFYEKLKDLKVVEDRYEEERKRLERFVTDKSNELKKIDFDIFKNAKDLSEKSNSIQKKLLLSIEKWSSVFKEEIDSEKFRAQLKNKLIVIIYGKVKAGKSYLGNVIASWSDSDPHFKVWDRAGNINSNVSRFEEIEEKEGFETNITECTSEIQLFELGGLAWVDTPGLSSMTPENGNLARKYINAADFVIFPTSSMAPLQRDEIEQIKELLQTGKNITVVITKSDDVDTDVVDGKIVHILKNKSDEDRKVQIEDVKKRLLESLGKDVYSEQLDKGIIAISAKTATTGLKEGDKDLYLKSNISQFYEKMTDRILMKADKLKKAAPFSGLSSLINSVIEGKSTESGKLLSTSLNAVIGESSNLCRLAAKFSSEVNMLKDVLLTRIPSIISEEIDNLEKDHDQELNNCSNTKLLFKNCNERISQKITALYEYELEKMFKSLKELVTEFTGSSESFEVKKKFDECKKHDNWSGTGCGFGALLGAGIGFFIGGPAGAAFGAGIGTTAGATIGKMISDDSCELVFSGTNRQKVLNSFELKATKAYSEQIESNFRVVFTNLIDPLLKQSREIEKELTMFKESLLVKQREYGEK